MKREWVRPQVAVISWQTPGGRSGGTAVAMRCSREYGKTHWQTETFGEISDDHVVNADPLVVIDPDDPVAAARFASAYIAAYAARTGDGGKPWEDRAQESRDKVVADLQATLRTIANPPAPEVLEHFVTRVDQGGVSTSFCGKVWRRSDDVKVVGRCETCKDGVKAGWSA